MHNITLLLIIISFLSFNSIYSQVQKQTDSLDKNQKEWLQEVVLSSKILGSKFEAKNRTGSAYFISSEELKQFGYTDVNRILRNVPGVSVYEEDGFGLRPNISLRGTSPERSAKITVMEDNVLIAPAPYSAPAAYYFPTVGRMESIEILKGSSQVQYGPYTTGGAINLVSKSIPTNTSGALRVGAGNFGGQNVEAYAGTSGEQWGFVAQYFNYSSDGFKSLNNLDNTGFDKNDFLAKLQFNSKASARIKHSINFKFQYSEEDSNETYLGLTDSDYEIDPYKRYAASQEDNMDTQHSQFQIDYTLSFAKNITVKTTAYRNDFKRNWYKLDDVLLTERVSIANVVSQPSIYVSEYNSLLGQVDTPDDAFGVKANNRAYYSQGIQSVFRYNFGSNVLHDIEIGIRYHQDEEDRFQWKDLYAMQNGEMIRTTVAERGSNANRIVDATALATHVLYKINFNNWTFTPGLRYENIELGRFDYGKEDPTRTGIELATRENNESVWIPGIGTQYRLNNEWSFFGGIHKGFAPPGTTEGTDAEESINLELGSRFNILGIQGELVGFFNDYSNLLGSDLAASGGTGSLDQFNAGEATVSGVEFLVNFDLLNLAKNKSNWQLPLSFSYTFTNAIFDTDFESEDGVFGEVENGDEIPYIARNQFNAIIALVHPKFELNLSTRYVDPIRTVAGSGSIPISERIDSNLVTDFSATYKYSKSISLFGNIINLFDTEYQVSRLPAGLRPGAPFMLQAGINYTF